MTRRRSHRARSRACLLGAVALALLGCGRDGGEADPRDSAPAVEPLGRPPVVVVLFDALHAAHLSHLGYPRETTPELDRLVAEGVSFARAFSPAPYTVAGVPSILTGRRPDSHGVTNQAARLASEETTLAEYLRAAGYRTMGAISNLNAGVRLGNDQGFEVFEELFFTDDPDRAEATSEGRPIRLVTADLVVDFARRMLARLAADTSGAPPFLYLHVLEPHAPYVMPSEYRELWLDPDYDGVFVEGDIDPFVRSLNEDLGLEQADIDAATALYDANLRWADHNFGLIRGLLEEAGLWDEALVVVTSDHGEAFWQHGRWGHNDHLFDEQLRVPLIVKLPGAAQDDRPGDGPARNVVRSELVSTIDLVPSVCEWLDLPVGELALDGLSLAPLVEDPGWTPPPRELILRSHHTIAHLALRTEGEKTIVERAETVEDGGFGATVQVRHFDLTADPGERVDLSGQGRVELEGVVGRLEEYGRRSIVDRGERGVGMTRTELHMLKNLGYIEEIPPRELSYEERVRRVTALGYAEVLEELDADSSPEDWKGAIQRAKARRSETTPPPGDS